MVPVGSFACPCLSVVSMIIPFWNFLEEISASALGERDKAFKCILAIMIMIGMMMMVI